MNFNEFIGAMGRTDREDRLHAHVDAERASEFTALDGGSAELEVLYFLSALVYLFKPRHLLETGTGRGLTSIALISGLKANAAGHLHTVEFDRNTIDQATLNVAALVPDAETWVTFHCQDSREFISSCQLAPFDFVLYDSLIAFRHIEFEMLLEQGLLTPSALCVFHDTSRLRGAYSADFNPEMIAALDRASQGRQWLESGLSRGLRILKLG